jgi:hypothetical protein
VSLNIEVPYNQGAGLYLPLTGGALTGPLALGANKITGLANGTAATDAATFGQVQTTEAALNPALEYNDLLGWDCDVLFIGVSQVLPAAATIYLMRIPLPGALTITNILCRNGIGGVTLTHSFGALFTSAGTVIGQTADQSTNWAAGAGLQTLALAGGPYVCSPLAANDFVWAGLYVGTAVTPPSFTAALNAIALNAGTTTARSRYAYIAQANTATLAYFSPAGITPDNANYMPWMAIS